MSRKRRSELFLHALLEEDEFYEKIAEDDALTELGDLSDGASMFSTKSMDVANDTDIYGQPIIQTLIPRAEKADKGHNNMGVDFVLGSNNHNNEPLLDNQHVPLEINIGNARGEPMRQELPPPPSIPPMPNNSAPLSDNATVEGGEYKAPKGRSIAHHAFKNNKVVLISLDIETAGEAVGIVQLSAEIIRMELVPNRSSLTKDTANNIIRDSNFFNEYVNPGEEKSHYWTAISQATHGLHPTHPKILAAQKIGDVWSDFCYWVHNNLKEDEVAIIVAWNGLACDMKAIWKLTQAPRSILNIPAKVKYFLDPYRVISSYKMCQLHPTKSKLPSLSLGVVWKHLNGANLNGAHDSLVDVKAQSDIITHGDFVPYIDRTQSIQEITDIFTKTQESEWKKKMESVRQVHEPWVEQSNDINVTWLPKREDAYTGPEGGAPAGPSTKIVYIAKKATSLAEIFLAIVPWSFFLKVAILTSKYCYEDWVVEKTAKNRDGIDKKKPYLSDCLRDTPGKRRRADNEAKKYDISASFILCWVAILIIQAGHFSSNKPASGNLWRKPPHGISMPYVRNTMPRNAFEFMRRNIHFADNSRRYPATHPCYDPLFKLAYPLKVFMSGINAAWQAGKYVTIDESMIKYMGRAISYVQYMPAKPIKHGIKVFVCCCALSAVILSFKVYVGKEEVGGGDGSAKSICIELLEKAGLTGQRGRTLYTDNWYTTMELAKHLWEKYRWTFCGTMTPTDKQSREDHDVPFLKLSNGALSNVERGWFREAVLKLKTATQKVFYVQHTTWKDKKQVCFLSTNSIGSSKNLFVQRSEKGKATRSTFPAPMAQQDYIEKYNAVDRNDQDSANWSTSIRTNRYYLRIFFWLLDRVIHCCYVIVCYLATFEVGDPKWKKYLSKHNGRHDFQIDLGVHLLNYALEMAWDGESERPSWMRQSEFVPCDCDKCYFCINGHTNGIAHPPKKKAKNDIFFANGEVLTTNKCMNVRVNLFGTSSRNCKMCYRKQPKGLTYGQKIANGNWSTKGCVVCKEAVCDDCWAKGYDKHQGAK